MRRLAPALIVLAAVLWPATAGAAQPGPFALTGSSASVKEKLAQEYPGASFPAAERDVCSSGEHSIEGPAYYCFVEFSLGETWHMAEVAVHFNRLTEPDSAITVYGHSSWQRAWHPCSLRKGMPGKLTTNDDCGRGAPEQELGAQTDADIIELEVLPRLRAHKAIRSVSRPFIYSFVAPYLSRFRATKKNGLFTFTNAVGDSFRFRP